MSQVTKIPNYSKYLINEYGIVYSLTKDRYLKGLNNNGYIQFFMVDDSGIAKWKYAHRLMATLYLPNPLNKAWVNHKDGNKGNNKIENLEWSTISENIIHSWETGLHDREVFRRNATGKKATIETKKKMSIARTNYWANKRTL